MPPVNIINDRSRAGLKMDRTFNHSQLAFNSVTSVTGSYLWVVFLPLQEQAVFYCPCHGEAYYALSHYCSLMCIVLCLGSSLCSFTWISVAENVTFSTVMCKILLFSAKKAVSELQFSDLYANFQLCLECYFCSHSISFLQSLCIQLRPCFQIHCCILFMSAFVLITAG